MAKRSISRISKLVGFGSSVIVLAIASLAAIPAMVEAAGGSGWGAIALGQSIGAIAAVVLAYGWGLSGPAKIALASSSERRAEYIDSIKVKSVLILPVCLASAGAAGYLESSHRSLAIAGAAQAATIGLTGNWYFVGVARPYLMLILETVPRAMGTVVAIVAMKHGASAVIGLGCIVGGMAAGFACVTTYVLSSTPRGSLEPDRAPRRRLVRVLASQRHGVTSHLLSTVYLAVPIVFVATFAPASQPVFALADKIQRQLTSALAPGVTVLQGWVPRASTGATIRRSNAAIGASLLSGLVLAALIVAGAPHLMGWLSAGQIAMTWPLIVLMTACIVVGFVEAVLSRAVLASFDRLNAVATATLVSTLIGLPAVALGAKLYGAIGALSAVLAGLLVRLTIELVMYWRTVRASRNPVTPSDVLAAQPQTAVEVGTGRPGPLVAPVVEEH